MLTLRDSPRRVLILLFAVATAVSAADSALAQPQASKAPLADRLPADALVYVGWVGSERVAELWEGTHTQAVVRQSNFEDLFTRYLPEALDKLAEQQPDAAQQVQLTKELLPLFLKRPSAFAFGGINIGGEGPPIPKFLFAIDAGDQADELEQRLRALIQRADQQPAVMFLGNSNGIVRFGMGYDLDELDRLAAGGGEGSLATSESFSAAFNGLSEEPLSAFFIDFPRLITMGEEAVRNFNPDEQEQVTQLIDALGLRGLGTMAATSGFAERMYETRLFLGLTGREGVLGLIPNGPLDQQTLAAIPAGSTMVTASQIDLAAAFDLARQIIVRIEPAAQPQIDRILAQVNEAAGVDVEADVLRQFGTTWAGYVSPQIGSGVFSGVVVNRPRDPAKLETALTEVSRNVLEMANQHIRQESEGAVSLPGRSVEIDGSTLHILNTPAFAPTWSIDAEGGVLRIALFPQSVLSSRALDGQAFMKSEGWQQLRQRLAPGGEVTSFQYYDLPALAPDSYPLILIASQTGLGLADMFGERLGTHPPVVVLPPLAGLMEHLSPAGTATWVTDGGVHYRAMEPFPMSTALTLDWQSFMAQQYSTMVSILLPSLNRAREAANRIKSGSNLRMIGQAMRQFAIDDVREGKYPADLRTLFLSSDLTPEVFVSPRSDTDLPEMMAQAREVQADWVNENSDFVWLGNGLTDSAPASVMVAYEDPEKTGWNEGINVLYADGSVRFILLPMFEEEKRRHIEYREQRGLPVPEVLQD